MRVFVAVIVLIFSLQSWTKADDIRDFEIEGMSIGDSLLDYFTEEEINGFPKGYYPKSKKYYKIESNDKFNEYEVVAFHIKNKDKKYRIISINGVIFFDKKLKKCKKKMNEIESDLSNFLNKNRDSYEEKEYPDKRGKVYASVFNLNNDKIRIWCVDFFKKTEKSGSRDNLAISIESYEFIDWLAKEAW